jgi:hypothetical protein
VSTPRRSALLLGLIAALAAGMRGGGERATPAPAGAAVVSERRVGPRQLDLTIRSPALGREATVRLLEPDRGARP